jgi:Ras-related protein Rab-2A
VFINTAAKIHHKIEEGIFDVSNESYGIKVGYGSGVGTGAETGRRIASIQRGGCCS